MYILMKTNTVIGEIPTRFLRRHNPESGVANQRETNRAAKRLSLRVWYLGKEIEALMVTENKAFGIDGIIREIKSGEYVKDALPDSAIGFIGEHEALYFSNLRRYLQSDLAKLVMDAEQSFDDLECLKEIGVIQRGR